jgi:ribonuclease D
MGGDCVASSYGCVASDANADGDWQAQSGREEVMELIRSSEGVRGVAEALSGAELFAADTEAAGYHRYHDRICLLQLSTRDVTFLVDTLAVDELGALAPLFASESCEVVLHDADYDLRLLARDFGIRVGGLFDTKLAAQLLGEPAIGLGALVEKYLGHRLDKKHQRADWAQRPLPPELLAYAAEDTRHLPALRDRLKAELERAGRLHWAQEEFSIREDARWEAETNGADGYLRVKKTRDLSARQMAALKELYDWREGVARRRDVATFRVVGNEILITVARALVADARQIGRVAGVPSSIAERYGADMSAAVRRALELPDSALPQRTRSPRRPPPDPEFESLVERLKGARDAAADELRLERGFLMPRQQLEEVARLQPRTADELLQVADMRRWQVEALGRRLLKAL